ncbi:uncharacterized protein LOC100707485 isoform X2 [Oreochromis niloticus]|uniref:uncharacterized protein LOC100707485 isoform X2 n=1 Tax=Oreochromis niloticus TaxID=8128 RepID=UPI000904A0BF|nr:uncharacterized protein LOC100707485 isoform X2 [Oreochromis niloticus]CAI5646093.1 unnamed protein product [Mustela putorius furo]CAI5646964.1 unnamed protein product [Mustela putorius furo]CAI5652777.1 unnamed protein product [Mustela putorius furo]CAI5688942.1 unnamed protein product [Mustela putorius furo]
MAESNNGSNNTTPQYQGNGAVESAVRNLVSLLLNNISTNPSGRPTESGQPEPRTLTIQQEMTRSFPGHFKSNLSRGKKRCLTSTKQLVKAGSKTTGLSFYLLSKNTSYTPLPAEELELLQAGMGRQTVSLPEDGDHAEISRLLEETFPKMEYLCGGWLLHKATGGSGRRKLTVIPPETEGYSVKTLKAVSGGGKSTFYIVPLQETLDTSPLPPDSQHFSKMPKKLCYQCNEVMPLQMLAVHINTCKGKFSPDETDDEESELCIVKSKCKVICPICTKDFPEDEITVHASLCGDSFQCMVPEENDQTTCTPTQTSVCTTDSVEDVLRCLEQQVDTTTEFKLCVDREDLPDRGILQWQRKKSASPTSVLRVVFIGEAGVDTGALRKEFLSDMISGIESRFFEGPENKGKNPKYSLTDLDNENFRTVGEIIAVSLAQGGPSPAFFKEWCYNFLCSGEVDFSCLSKEDVADVESSLLISKVEDAADIQSLMLWADEIVTCGYTNQIKMDSKESMIRAIVLHSTTRLIPMLQQLRKGMELYGLVNLMAVNPEACHSLFVPGKILKPDADFIMMSCQPHFSEKGTSRERTERKIINFLQDFLQEIEASDGNTGGAGGEKSESLAVQHVLQWMTGQSHVPILPDEKRHFKITCKFDHECKERLGDHSICYPVVSACTCTVTFPVQHLDTYTMFKTIMSAAVRYGGGFHRV